MTKRGFQSVNFSLVFIFKPELSARCNWAFINLHQFPAWIVSLSIIWAVSIFADLSVTKCGFQSVNYSLVFIFKSELSARYKWAFINLHNLPRELFHYQLLGRYQSLRIFQRPDTFLNPLIIIRFRFWPILSTRCYWFFINLPNFACFSFVINQFFTKKTNLSYWLLVVYVIFF